MVIETLQKNYSEIVTFADLRATGFFSKLGFKSDPQESANSRKNLLAIIENCSKAKLMIYQKNEVQ